MIVEDGFGNYIAVYNNSYLPIKKYCEKNYSEEKINYIKKCLLENNIPYISNKSYTINIGDLHFQIFAIHVLKIESALTLIEFLIKINHIDGFVRFTNLKKFCERENIHDFDIFFQTIMIGKWLAEYTKEERNFFIKNFGMKEETFFNTQQVYIENGIKYNRCDKRFIPFNEWWTYSMYNKYCFFTEKEIITIPQNCENILSYVSSPITQEEFFKQTQDKLIIVCKNNYDDYHICLVNDSFYIKCRNYCSFIYCSKDFYKYYDKNIVQQFINQKEFYDKTKEKS